MFEETRLRAFFSPSTSSHVTEAAVPNQIMNPYPLTRPRLYRAFEEGVRAARPTERPIDYICVTEGEHRAWVKGFVRARMADG